MANTSPATYSGPGTTALPTADPTYHFPVNQSVLNSLTQGTAPPNADTLFASQQGLPSWYQQYLQSISAQGLNVANANNQVGFYGQIDPTTGLPVPGTSQAATVASLTDPQTAAIQATQDLQGSQAPGMAAAQNYVNTITPNVNAAAANANQIAAPNTGTFTGSNVSKYLSPYTQNVINGLVNTSNMNLFNNIIPNINSSFVGSGQFGSTRNADVLMQGINQNQLGLGANVSQALQAGYGQAGQQFASDQGQQIQGQQLGATTALNAGQLQATGAQAAGQQTGALTQANNAMNLQNIGALGAAGQTLQTQNQNVANANQANAIANANYDWQQLNNLSGLVRGQQLPTTSTSISAGPAANYAPSPLAQVGAGLGLQMASAPAAIQ